MKFRIFTLTFLFLSFKISLPMELVKKATKQKYKNDSALNKVLLFTHTLITKKTLPRDIGNQIILFTLAITDKDFTKDNHQDFKNIWQNHNIPMCSYYFLTSKQKKLMCYMSNSQSTGHYYDGPQVYYFVKSPKHYDLFLTLPLELRTCLTFLPTTTKETYLSQTTSPYINKDKIIQVKGLKAEIKSIIHHTDSNFTDSFPKPIIPEETKKTTSKK